MAPLQSGPVFSVVIPNYHSATHLRNVLQALSRQTYRHFSVVIADDGSTNAAELQNICYEAALPEITFLALPHRGPAAARNAGAAASASEYVAFTDADCLPESGWLEEFASLAGLADVIYGRVVTEPGYLPPRWVAPVGERFVTANVMCKRETFFALGGFDTRYQPHFR